MKNKNEMKQKNYLYTREDTGYCYEITIKKEKGITHVDVLGRGDGKCFGISFTDRNNLIKILVRVILEKELLEEKIKYAIKELE